MPFQRPLLSELKTRIAQDIAAALPGTDALLRFSNLSIIGRALARLVNGNYGYLDYIALNATPFTAVDEALQGWAALRKVFQKPATFASGAVTFPATNGTLVPAGTLIARGDGVQYTSTADATAASNVVIVLATADPDPAGLVGANTNAVVSTVMTLANAIAGVQSVGAVSTAFTGGADVETNDSLRARMLAAYSHTPGIGTEQDYVDWALAVPGVTRAWALRNSVGSGTVTVYTMFDETESAFGGFPQGTNGVATDEPRDTVATGDQLAVADYIYDFQPVTALVYSNAPTNGAVNFTINGISGASVGTKAAIAAAIADVFIRLADPTSTSAIPLSEFEAAIGSVPLTTGFVITAPAGNVTQTIGQLRTHGTDTYT